MMWTAEIQMKRRFDHRSCNCNLSNCKFKPEKNCKTVQITALKTYMESVLVRSNGDRQPQASRLLFRNCHVGKDMFS